MTLAVPGPASLAFTSRAPSIIIVGADALLAALPATPVQLAHACMKAGFQHVVPASWGDELIAAGVMRQLDDRVGQPMVQCTCPLVAHRLLSVGTDLSPFLVTLAPPPVALARYLRVLYGAARLRITYAGRCPGADDDVIDARLAPDELLALFADRHIVLDDQPQVFDSVIPPDRRRHVSEPGGVPTADVLWTNSGGRALVEITEGDLTVELAQLLLTERNVLIDPAPLLGCACSGAASRKDVGQARERVTELEPPRSPSPIVDARVAISLTPSVPTKSRSFIATRPEDVHLPVHAARPAQTQPVAPLPAAELEVASAEPVVASTSEWETRDVPAADDAVTIAPAPVFASSAASATTETIVITEPDDAPVAVAVAVQAEPVEVSADPAQLEIALAPEEPEIEHREAPSPRRTAPFGVMRSVVGDTPMTRDSSGRQLPRAYVLRRRSSPRSTPAIAVDVSVANEEMSAQASLPPTESAVISHTEPVAAPEVIVVTHTAPTTIPTVTYAPPAREGDRGTLPLRMPRAEVEAPPQPAPPQTERTLPLPVERHSDAAPARPTPRRSVTARAPREEEKQGARRSWLWIVLLVLAVALVSSIGGAALVTWYARQHPPASSQR